MVNKGRPKNAPNKKQVITYSNVEKVKDINFETHIVRMSVKEPTRYFLEQWLLTRVGSENISHLDNGLIGISHSYSSSDVLQQILQVVPSATLEKEPKTKLWTLYV